MSHAKRTVKLPGYYHRKVRWWKIQLMMAFMGLRLMDVLNSLRKSDLAAKEDFPMPSNLLASYKYSA